ncbi:proteinase inhibitor I25 cystatin [Kocuria polaris]|nr:proteinase inhibitor I25 cystatin [Kocuria polaris]
MALNASTTLPYPADAVASVFADREFVQEVSTKAGGRLTDFEVTGPVSGAFDLKVVRAVPTDRLPDLARKFVGATMTVTQRESWSAPAADGSRTATITIDVAGAPVDVKATQKLVARGSETVVELDGKVTSSIPFMGGKIASAAEPYLGKALNLQAAAAKAWLDARN